MHIRTALFSLVFILGTLFMYPAYVKGQAAYKTVVPVKDILKNQMAFLYYERDYLRFSEDFIAYDVNGKKISKGEFLKQLCTGFYLPIRLPGDTNALLSYHLHRLNSPDYENFRDVLTSLGNDYYNCYKYEGQKFPDVSFADLDGQNHTIGTYSGKTTVINFWFIKCSACNEEMPRLNEIKTAYNGRGNIQFFAIAFDPIAALKNFELKKNFDYTLCYMPETDMEQIVGINEYPTTFIIDKNGIILKVTHEAEELNTALKKFAKSK